ncbi:MAG: diguanylate cyclase [Clostridia bacterium]|nr:diguanylate cyclase [Clostridia bacterium]
MGKEFYNDNSLTEIDEYIVKLLDSLWHETLSGNMRTIFFNTASSDSFTPFLDFYLSGVDTQQCLVLRQKVVEQSFTKPYFPFLDFIKDYLKSSNTIEVDELVKNAGVYHFQKPIFSSYLSGEISNRYEEILLEELDYEREQMLESIMKLYFSIADSMPIIILIEDLHNAKESTLSLIRYFLNNKQNKKIFLIFSLNRCYSCKTEDINDYWESFIEYLEAKSLLIDFGFSMPKERRVTEEIRTNLGGNVQGIIDLSLDCFNFLALSECKEYINKAYNFNMLNTSSIPSQYMFKMLRILGDVNTYIAEYDTALIHYNSLLNIAQQADNKQEIADVYRKIGFIYLKKDNVDIAERFSNQSLKLALEIDDELQVFRAYFLLFLIEDKGRKYSLGQWRETYRIIIKLAGNLNMKNTLSYYCTNPYGLYSQYTHDNETLHNYGLKIAEKYKNKYRLATAYQTKGLVYAVKGDYSEVLKYYKKSEELKLELGNKLELSYIYNGLGFYYYMTEDYENAHMYYSKALICLKTVRDYHEITMTFFNIAANFFFAFKHKLAIQYLEKLLLIMNILQINGLKYHSLHGIYSLIAVAYYKNGNIAKAYEYLTKIKIKNLQPYPEKNEEYFLFELLQAFLLKEEKKYLESEKCFESALVYLQKENDVIKYMAPRFYYEYGIMFKEQNQLGRALTMFETGIEKCKELNYTFHESLLRNEINNGDYEIKKLKFKKKIFDFGWTIEAVRLEVNLTKLHKKINEINFLNILQNILAQGTEKSELINKVMNLINNSFLVELSFLCLKEYTEWKLVYSNKSIDDIDLDIMKLISMLSKEASEELIQNVAVSKYKDVAASLTSIVSLPLLSNNQIVGNILCATKKEDLTLTYSDLQILSIASKQLAVALDKIDRDQELIQKNKELNEANRKLSISASTDALTGLYNRQELHRKLEEEKIRVLGSTNRIQKGFSILFIDLDNFKHYNDSFGHQIGDLILTRFAEVLRKNTRNVDFIARFGGDEFIVVLTETETEGASYIASKIQFELIRRRQFQADIEEFLDKKIYVSEDSKLTCSIGIAECNVGVDIDSEVLLQRADKALYLAKKSGKNQYKTWQETAVVQ